MRQVSNRFADAVRHGGVQVAYVEIVDDANTTRSQAPEGMLLPVMSGQVPASEQQPVMRTLECTIVDDTGELTPASAGDLLARRDTELRAWSGWEYGPDDREVVPVGTFRIADFAVSESQSGDVQISVSGVDRAQRLIDDVIDAPIVITHGTRIDNAIGQLVLDGWASVQMQLPSMPGVLPEVIVEGDRWATCREWAAMDGHLLHFDTVGNLVATPLREDTVDTPVVWRFDENDPNTTMASLSRQVSHQGSYNRVVAVAQGTHVIDPIIAFAEDDDPESPTYVGGGRKTRTMTLTDLMTLAEARALVESELHKTLMPSEAVQVSALPHPGLEPVDVVDVVRERAGLHGTRPHVVSSLTLPLGGGGLQQVTMRPRRLRQPPEGA